MDAHLVTNVQRQWSGAPACLRLTHRLRLLSWAIVTTILLAGCSGPSAVKPSPPLPTASASAPEARASKNCRQLLESSPQATGADPPLVSKVAADGSLKLLLPSDLVAGTGQPPDYIIRFQAQTGFYPAYGVRLFHHTGKVPDSWALSHLEAQSTEKRKGVILPVLVAIPVSLEAAAPGTAGRIDVCLGPGSGWPNPWTVVIQWLIPIADGPNAWKEYVIELTTTLDRYGADAPIASTVANSLRFLT